MDPQNNWALHGNFAPTKTEVFREKLRVTTGSIPTDVEGVFMRVGPNPILEETGGYHIFDGQGKVHAIRIKDGKVNYSNKIMETERFHEEMNAGFAVHVRIGDMKGIWGLVKILISRALSFFGVLSDIKKSGTANTNTIFHHGKLFALLEASLPFPFHIDNDGRLKSGDNSYDFSGGWSHSFTAHPKIDPITNELIFFGYSFNKPYCVYGVSNSEGVITSKFQVDIPQPVMMHDFSITEHYSIIMDLPLVFEPRVMIEKNELPFIFNDSRPSRFGIFPRNANNNNQIKWFEAKPCYVFHVLNSWEEGDEIVLIAARSDTQSLTQLGNNRRSIYQWRFNLATGVTEEKVLHPIRSDFPRVHPTMTGRQTRYGYFATLIDDFKMDGFVKIDLANSTNVKKATYGDKIYGGEVVYVPKVNSVDEDDGYCMVFVHNESKNVSSFLVYSAKDLSLVTKIDLEDRVPYGFHANFLTEAELSIINS
eukprot:TRINITY_DN5795_c0_g2_i1.p1 TRINITY_DN5795_c0_g2~~TRINITY_DN5795_c0_g2_i1.p1  ORF type:complete len:530 (-),score=99.41 TRINITY_DN5795_c0_g2_i1:45-1481(-)